MTTLVFDNALITRLTTNPAAVLADVTSTDTILLYNTATGTILRCTFAVLLQAIQNATSTSDIAEGTNLYFTNERASAAAPVQSVAGKTGTVALVKGDVGLGNVDNTSDASKPVSTAQATALALKADIALQAWQAPTLTNSWVNYGSGFNDAGYYKDPHGIVHLRGFIKSGTMQQAAFTLPSGYRPPNKEVFATGSNDAFGELFIGSDGTVNPWIGSNVWFCLDGITFRT